MLEKYFIKSKSKSLVQLFMQSMKLLDYNYWCIIVIIVMLQLVTMDLIVFPYILYDDHVFYI